MPSWRNSGEPNTAVPWSPMPIALPAGAGLLGVARGLAAPVGVLWPPPPHPPSSTSASAAIVMRRLTPRQATRRTASVAGGGRGQALQADARQHAAERPGQPPVPAVQQLHRRGHE